MSLCEPLRCFEMERKRGFFFSFSFFACFFGLLHPLVFYWRAGRGVAVSEQMLEMVFFFFSLSLLFFWLRKKQSRAGSTWGQLGWAGLGWAGLAWPGRAGLGRPGLAAILF